MHHVVIPWIFVHLKLLSKNMHTVSFSQARNEALKLMLYGSNIGSLPVLDDGTFRLHVDNRHNSFRHADPITRKVHYLVWNGFDVLNEYLLILPESERCRFIVNNEDGCQWVVPSFKHSCVLHDLVVDVDWSEWLVCKIEDMSLFEVMQ